LSTTRSPVRSVAAWTWAMEAEASGSVSISVNMPVPPSSSPSTRSICAQGSGLTRSCSRPSSLVNSGGSRSRRVDRAWPNFTNTTPLRSSASVSDRASETDLGP
jgi:hypothetical protein